MTDYSTELLQLSSYVIGILLGALICAIVMLLHYRRKLKRMAEPDEDEQLSDVVTAVSAIPSPSALVAAEEPQPTNSKKENPDSIETADAARSVAVSAAVENSPKAEAAEERLFRDVTHTIWQEQLYLQPGFGRSDIVERFKITPHRAGMLFSKRQTSIPEFVRNCRLEHAERMMADQPHTSLADIAKAVGFLHLGTFMHDFKDKYGMTPTQFRESRQNEKI